MKRRSFMKRASFALPIGTALFSKAEPAQSKHQTLCLPDDLKEEVWDMRERPQMWTRLFPEQGSPLVCRLWTHAYGIYIDRGDQLIPIDCFYTSGEPHLPNVSFRTFMARCNPRTWNELFLACELHALSTRERAGFFEIMRRDEVVLNCPIASWPASEFKPMPVVDGLLQQSRGALIWDHQMHSLYGLFDPFTKRATRFRKHVNARTEGALEEAIDMIFPDGRSLADIIEERMIFGYTKHPDPGKAFGLLPYLSG